MLDVARRILPGCLVVACLLLAAACDSPDGEASAPATDRVVHEEGEGPLSAHTGLGDQAIAQPGKPPWKASFGSFLLCSTTGAEIEIEDVRFVTKVEPQRAEAWFRTIPEASERNGGKPISWSPIGMLWGSHPDYLDGTRMHGDFRRTMDGPLAVDCEDLADPDNGRVELVTVLSVGETGAWVQQTHVDYRVAGAPYTLVIRWQNLACGTEIPKRFWCPKLRRIPMVG